MVVIVTGDGNGDSGGCDGDRYWIVVVSFFFSLRR